MNNTASQFESNYRKDAADVYADRLQDLIKKPSVIQWDEKPETVPFDETITRGKEYSDSLQCLTFPIMRIGFFLQTFALAILLFMHHGHGSLNSWTFDFYNINENIRTSNAFIYSVILLLITYGAGTLSLLIFQGFINDNGKYSRGFRAGSKIFQTAILLDLLTLAIRLVSFIYAFRFMSDRWWIRFNQTRTDLALFKSSHLLHGLSLVLYGVGLFYMEVYHDEGTYEEFGWLILGMYGFAGISEIMLSVSPFGAYFSYIQLFSLCISTFWAFSYEPLMHYHMTALHDRTVNDAVLCNNYRIVNDDNLNEIELTRPNMGFNSNHNQI